jgi:hypothetical protein
MKLYDITLLRKDIKRDVTYGIDSKLIAADSFEDAVMKAKDKFNRMVLLDTDHYYNVANNFHR